MDLTLQLLLTTKQFSNSNLLYSLMDRFVCMGKPGEIFYSCEIQEPQSTAWTSNVDSGGVEVKTIKIEDHEYVKLSGMHLRKPHSLNLSLYLRKTIHFHLMLKETVSV